MSSHEFGMWIAYAESEPFGYPMENYRMAVPASRIINAVNSTKGTRQKMVQPEDLYPSRKKATEPTLTDEQAAFIEKKRKHGKRRNRNR
jgi:hypothetical protein